MDFQTALHAHDRLDSLLTIAENELKKASGTERGPMGLIPDHVKASPEWQAAKRNFEMAKNNMGKYNRYFIKKFKKEWRETLVARRTFKNQ